MALFTIHSAISLVDEACWLPEDTVFLTHTIQGSQHPSSTQVCTTHEGMVHHPQHCHPGVTRGATSLGEAWVSNTMRVQGTIHSAVILVNKGWMRGAGSREAWISNTTRPHGSESAFLLRKPLEISWTLPHWYSNKISKLNSNSNVKFSLRCQRFLS